MLAVCSCAWITFLVVVNHALPDAATMTAVLALPATPYAVNKIPTVMKGGQ